MLNADQLQTLRAFMDANAGTYSALNDQQAAVTLNALTENRIKASLTGAEIYESTDGAEFSALQDAKKSQWLSLCAIATVDPANGTPAQILASDLFGAGSTTLINLQALRSETVSPATTQGLPRVRAEDVRLARLL